MEDPLERFDWGTLYVDYDSMCRRYHAKSPYLSWFGADRPDDDRKLYYRLIDAYAPARRAGEADSVGLYKALLYWKLYSQHTTPRRFDDWTAKGDFDHATNQLPELLAALPDCLDRNVDSVISEVRRLGAYTLPGMKSACTLPVRTTFLHFLYPSSVPILDRMVLRAVGECRAAGSYSVLSEYLPFAWRVADKYAATATMDRSESPLRLIDMALWVNRGRAARDVCRPVKRDCR